MEMEPTHMDDDGGMDDISWAHPYVIGSPSFPQGWTSRGCNEPRKGIEGRSRRVVSLSNTRSKQQPSISKQELRQRRRGDCDSQCCQSL